MTGEESGGQSGAVTDVWTALMDSVRRVREWRLQVWSEGQEPTAHSLEQLRRCEQALRESATLLQPPEITSALRSVPANPVLARSLVEYANGYSPESPAEGVSSEADDSLDTDGQILSWLEDKLEEFRPCLPPRPPLEVNHAADRSGATPSGSQMQQSSRPTLADLEPLIEAEIVRKWTNGGGPSSFTRKEIALAVGCSFGTVSNSRIWKTAMVLRAALRENNIAWDSLRLSSTTLRRALSAGEMTREEALNALIADQAADVRRDARDCDGEE